MLGRNCSRHLGQVRDAMRGLLAWRGTPRVGRRPAGAVHMSPPPCDSDSHEHPGRDPPGDGPAPQPGPGLRPSGESR